MYMQWQLLWEDSSENYQNLCSHGTCTWSSSGPWVSTEGQSMQYDLWDGVNFSSFFLSLHFSDLTNKKERQETLHKLISRLPVINHAVFERLMFHLARYSPIFHIHRS